MIGTAVLATYARSLIDLVANLRGQASARKVSPEILGQVAELQKEVVRLNGEILQIVRNQEILARHSEAGSPSQPVEVPFVSELYSEFFDVQQRILDIQQTILKKQDTARNVTWIQFFLGLLISFILGGVASFVVTILLR